MTQRSDGTAVCTISRPPASGDILHAEWVGATGDSFVALNEMR